MKICVFDTETTNLEKPFCYNVGYVIYDTDKHEIICKEEFVIEQIWHNAELFSTSYYAEKRPIYVNRMRAKKIALEKWGYVTQRMARIFKLYNVDFAFAYNSPFDTRVFEWNCEWFKTINPFDNIPIIDIRGYVHCFLAFDKTYQEWCDLNEQYTESGNYSTTAETVYRFIASEEDFEEEHTALADTEIELEILLAMVERGAVIGDTYKVYSSIPRIVEKNLIVRSAHGEDYIFPYKKIRINKDKTEIKLT